MDTATATFTKTDIRKVFENFAADLFMLVRRTGTMDLEWARDIAHDVMQMAISECLAAVHIQLLGASGHLEKVHKYTVRGEGNWQEERPGANDWPRSPGGRLDVVVVYANTQIAEALKRNGALIRTWGPSGQPLDYSRMLGSGNREYSSNTYGLTRESYTAR